MSWEKSGYTHHGSILGLHITLPRWILETIMFLYFVVRDSISQKKKKKNFNFELFKSLKIPVVSIYKAYRSGYNYIRS